MEGLTFVRDLTWPEVFKIWRGNEEHLEKWKELYKKRGFETWEVWRRNLIAPMDLESRTWKLYRIETPGKTIANFHGGPFRGWTERYYDGVAAPEFREIIKHPNIKTVFAFQDFIANFPSPTTVTGVQNDDGVVIIEGMHRSTSVVLAAAEGKDLEPEMYIALADYQPGHLPLVGKRD
ncbi:hypothetical protein M0Q28_03255 [Patescibacteria group bacterium]|jgi:hypothetical protein|nr:hypothetical protein [Patescibacteria group bacterium]